MSVANPPPRFPASQPEPARPARGTQGGTIYIAEAIAAVEAELPGLAPQLTRLYALLALAKGIRTTPADVHDAWAMDTATTRPNHPCLVPAAQLHPRVRELDEPFVAGIHRAARRLTDATLRSARAETDVPHDNHREPGIRVAAVGDLHVRDQPTDLELTGVETVADLLLVAGDLTQHGSPEQARHLADVLSRLDLPVVTVLGNHDFNSGGQDTIAGMLTDCGVHVLDGGSLVLSIRDTGLGVAGVKGFGGGFPGGTVHEFGEPEIKDFAAQGRQQARMLAAALAELDDGPQLALTHYAPAVDTLDGEPPELYPLLGSRLLGEAIDQAGVTLAVHGHAHHGVEHGRTAGGVPVRNVARRVIQAPYRVYHLYRSGAGWTVAAAPQPAVRGGGDAS